MAADTGGEKSLPPSAMKLQRAREKGNVYKSQDLAAGFSLSVALLALYILSPYVFEAFLEANRHFIGRGHELIKGQVTMQHLLLQSLYLMGVASVPFLLVMVLAAVVGNLAQVGFLLSAQALQPNLSRLNPISGMKKFVSVRTFIELIKSIIKLIVVTWIVYLALRSRLDEVILLMALTPHALLGAVSNMVVAVWWRVALAMILLGILDFAFQRWQHMHEQRMTHQEAKEEMRELEGDPKVKGRVRQLQRQMAMQRMMAEVPEADVVVTNPTHYAVALRYNPAQMTAPVLVAKGARLTAQRIRELAEEHQVPIVRQPELARGIYQQMEIGQSVPEELFRAVAEVLTYVFQIDRRAEKQRERQQILRPVA